MIIAFFYSLQTYSIQIYLSLSFDCKGSVSNISLLYCEQKSTKLTKSNSRGRLFFLSQLIDQEQLVKLLHFPNSLTPITSNSTNDHIIGIQASASPCENPTKAAMTQRPLVSWMYAISPRRLRGLETK